MAASMRRCCIGPLAAAALAALAPPTGGGAEVVDVSSPELPAQYTEACDTEEWRHFLQLTRTFCAKPSRWYCMHHPFFADTSWELLASAMQTQFFCFNGVAAASVIFLRDLEHRGDGVVTVDVTEDAAGTPLVTMAYGRSEARKLLLPLDHNFDPFPFTAADLLQYRVRSSDTMALLCRRMAEIFLDMDQIWLPWLGFLRFWAERGSPEYREGAGRVSVDVLVPLAAEPALLALQDRLLEASLQDPLRGLYLYEVHPHRMLQLSLNSLPELGNGMDVRYVCPTCTVVNIYFIAPDGSLTTEAPPCRVAQEEIRGLEEFRDHIGWDAADGLMPHEPLLLLRRHGQRYFAGVGQERPCSLAPDAFEAITAAEPLGPMSRKLLADYAPLDGSTDESQVPEGGYLHYDEAFHSLRAATAAEAAEAERRKLVLPCTDFSKEVRGLHGAAGWFAYIEARMTAERPALTVFQTKTYMKKLMSERGAPIPPLLYASMDSPDLPWGPPLPRIPGGYVIKPAHLAESSNVFVIDEDGINLLTGVEASWDDVQNNITFAWTRSLGDYDQASGDVSKQQCARSKRYGKYIEGRSCTNWALYRSPPGLLIEEMVRPSLPYEALQETAFKDQNLDIQWRRQPDEIKCHVVWGKVFAAEWVSTPAFLGFVFRHGFVKDNIVLGPRTLELCDRGALCEFSALWAYVVAVAEAAVPPGVDYMRVDIFPNGLSPVVNELSVAGYATLLEEWMLAEMMRKVKEGYLWRGFDVSDVDPDTD